ncbi:RNA-binding protein [Bradyrhizobium prioriisuperbiae]|uniref:RNA-binding protein n=1 Tax=Bradyrhizobium prioriisuperbiae TaxID=2854389 RepID=UPI0028F06539|nr:RNA-binding protein [Bradyrhizobium prioritasuperba]
MLAALEPADLDDGPRTAKSGTERMCAVTRQVQPIEDLIRFVVAPDGQVVADLKRKLPGRGLWVSAAQGTVAEAVKRGVFGRGFKRDVRVSPDFLAETENLMVRSLIEALAMAGKAGAVVSGFSKVETALQRGETAALIHASDGAADGIRKLDATARQIAGETGEIPVLNALTSAELDLALGRSNVIHAALRAGSAAETVLARCRRVVRFRAEPDRRVTKISKSKDV